MQPGIEQIIALAVGTVAAGLAAFRFYGRRLIVQSYTDGRRLRLLGDYEQADKKLAVASVSYPSAQILRFWMMVETVRIADAQALLKELPVTLSAQEGATWLALRQDSIAKAEQEVAKLLHLMNLGKLLPYQEASCLYTHACLLVEEGSNGYALEKFNSSINIARDNYGMASIYTVPQAVALSYLNFCAGNFDKSAKLLANGLRAYRKELGEHHPRTARVRAMLAIVAGSMSFDEPARRELTLAANSFHRAGMDDTDDARTTIRALAWLGGVSRSAV
jgi:hypothetical protein